MAEDRGYKTGQRIWDQERARRFPELGDPKRRSLYGIGYRMAGAACPRVNQYEYLTSIGARVLLPAEKVGYGELLIAQSSIYGVRFERNAWRIRRSGSYLRAGR